MLVAVHVPSTAPDVSRTRETNAYGAMPYLASISNFVLAELVIGCGGVAV